MGMPLQNDAQAQCDFLWASEETGKMNIFPKGKQDHCTHCVDKDPDLSANKQLSFLREVWAG